MWRESLSLGVVGQCRAGKFPGIISVQLPLGIDSTDRAISQEGVDWASNNLSPREDFTVSTKLLEYGGYTGLFTSVILCAIKMLPHHWHSFACCPSTKIKLQTLLLHVHIFAMISCLVGTVLFTRIETIILIKYTKSIKKQSVLLIFIFFISECFCGIILLSSKRQWSQRWLSIKLGVICKKPVKMKNLQGQSKG